MYCQCSLRISVKLVSYNVYIYINLSTSNTLLQIFMKTCIIYLYICIVKIILWMCHHKTLEKFELQNSGPIVLIKVSNNCT